MASVLQLSALLACVVATAAEASVTLRGAADASGRPPLTNMTLPLAAVDCPKTHGDKSQMDVCFTKAGCAWTAASGCRDWNAAKFCSFSGADNRADCEKVEIYHGVSTKDKPCTWYPGMFYGACSSDSK
eukprot:CAMPEP_0198487434 /NCGR_PEP_ID=MMETSP1462-20131121/21_1 /TAXON_ID=1333877 /ORGANISM="Brandtodinium nutriculum, Strain RCC3387" /LENGTH=128 /DNA_ID=CAMNT_0044215869 /DNA_START=101 /DNA_END=487 /DNA_ORIENTATION=+